MSEINTNRLRASVRLFRRDYSEKFRFFKFTTWKSRDHDMPRQETTFVVQLLWLVLSVKWRPDGKVSP
jgi:hypothetical protein